MTLWSRNQANVSADLSDRTLVIKYPILFTTWSNRQRETEAIS